MDATLVKQRLNSLASKDVAAGSKRFFKSGPGDYGEDDQFIGVRVPQLRTLAKEFGHLPISEITQLLESQIHEERLLALFLLVQNASKADQESRRDLFELYLSKTKYVNNWDLVDSSAPALVGGYLIDAPKRERSKLTQLAKSSSLWERRIAIIATQYFIRNNQFEDTLRISRLLLSDPHDLIHKACGWMLRESGKRKPEVLIDFLEQHAASMPRTMLRYAIEHLSTSQRHEYLKRRHE